MPLGQLHISRGDLLLSVNGELSPRRQIAVNAHVQGVGNAAPAWSIYKMR
jgi:hypothetical protein